MTLYELLKAALVRAGLANPGTTDHTLAVRIMEAMGVKDESADAETTRRWQANPMHKWIRG